MIFVVTGPPAGGKSTYVETNMRPGDIRADFDLIAQACGSAGTHDPLASDSVMAVAAAARRSIVGRALDSEAPLSNDAWLIWQKVPSAYRGRLEAVDAKFITIDPGKEECLRRAREDGRPQRTFDGIELYYAGDDSEKGDREVRTKSCKAVVEKSTTSLDRGEVTMIVSAFGNVDSYGDEVMPGAFTESLKKWEDSGNPIPFIWSHDWGNPEAHIGAITSAKETEAGLEVTAKIDLDRPFAAQVFRLLKERRVTQASFAFDVLESEWVEREAPDGAKYEVYELRKLDLLEAGPCLIGVNRETELLDAKAREVMQRVLSELSEGRKSPPNQSGTQPEVDTESATKSAQSRARLTLTALEGI